MFWKISPQGLSWGKSPYTIKEKGEELVGRSISAVGLILAFTLMLLLPAVPESNALESSPYLIVNPTMYVAHAKGELFNVTIDVINIDNLSSYQFTVVYNNSLLKAEQVSPGSFFPPAPLSHMNYDNNTSLGSIGITCSLSNPTDSVSGSGTLASITFRVIFVPDSCLGSPLELRQTLLLDSAHVSIVHDLVGALYFWKSAAPDPPIEGRLLDVYTPKGGMGQGQPDGNYTLGEEVQLISEVTYNGFPVQGKLVAFQVQNPSEQISILRTAITNQDGFATVSFRIPNVLDSLGTWIAISVVEIAEKVAWDIVTFEVVTTKPVGGFSTALKRSGRADVAVPYSLMVIMLTFALVKVKRKAKTS